MLRGIFEGLIIRRERNTSATKQGTRAIAHSRPAESKASRSRKGTERLPAQKSLLNNLRGPAAAYLRLERLTPARLIPRAIYKPNDLSRRWLAGTRSRVQRVASLEREPKKRRARRVARRDDLY